MTTLLLGLRACLFYIGYIFLIVWFSSTGVLFFSFCSFNVRSRYILGWNRCAIRWATWVCGLRIKIIGEDNLPDAPYVALAKHQSQWETYFLQYYLAPVCIVLKRELLQIPFFGWGLRLSDPIAIDRSSPKDALKKVSEQGQQRLEQGISMLIFPEGTRVKTGESGRYARSGANIAISAKVPVVPIALNAGEFWPPGGFIKYPGTITVVIGEPIDTTHADSKSLTKQVEQWIEGQVATLERRM